MNKGREIGIARTLSNNSLMHLASEYLEIQQTWFRKKEEGRIERILVQRLTSGNPADCNKIGPD